MITDSDVILVAEHWQRAAVGAALVTHSLAAFATVMLSNNTHTNCYSYASVAHNMFNA